MNILVCIKQVACVCAPQGVNPQTGTIDPAGVVYRVNPCDEVAVEEALRIRERSGGGTVTLVTVGPSRAEDALRWGLAMGADRGIHLQGEEADQYDVWETAQLLSRVIDGHSCDLVLLGNRTIEHGSGQVGIFVAELLDRPVVTSVVRLDLSAGGPWITAERSLERGDREVVDCPLPAVLTVDKGLNRPRYPTWPARRASREKPIQQVDWATVAPALEAQAWPKAERIKVAPPRLRPKKILAPDSNLSPSAKLQFIMAGGMGQKKGSAIGGDAEQLAGGIIDFLKERKFI